MSDGLSSILTRYWGYKSFRPGQREIIESVLQNRDTMALLPTGGGKSICYQVPALARDGLCLVISPLIALMQDQVAALKQRGILAEALHAGMHYNEVKQTLENCVHGPYKLLYVSPERLQTELFQEYLPELRLNLIAVDEAHCISQWGHDFRPEYLKISWLREVFTNIPILALTASATEEVQEDIALQLKMRKPAIFQQSFDRQNLFYDVQYSENKPGDTLLALQEVKGCAIVYCRSRKQTETVSRQLQQQGIEALPYHAGMGKDRREASQQAWMQGKSRVMVATTAFGMGIDKPDVRLVLHYDASEHLEAYYQEAGRGGRDGKPALAKTLFNKTDLKRLAESTAIQFPPQDYLRLVYQSVCEYLQIPIGNQPDRYFSFDLADFCKKFNLEALPAASAMRLLAQEGLWTLTDAVFKPATIHFRCEREDLDALQRQHPSEAYIATGLLRLYSGIFLHETVIRIPAIANALRLPHATVKTALYRLHGLGIISYNEPGEGPQLFFHHLRADSRHLILNVQRIANLRRRHEARTEAMLHFLQQENLCRNKLLLNYFGEHPTQNCGHCDVCRRRDKPTGTRVDLEKLILETLRQTGPLSIQQLIHALALGQAASITQRIRTLLDEGKIRLMAGNLLTANR